MGTYILISSPNFLGHGVFAGSRIDKGEYLANFRGELINMEECKKRLDNNIGTYVFIVTDGNGKDSCIDAKKSDSISKFVNDSPEEHANSEMRVLNDGRNGEAPLVALYSTKVINKG